MIRHGVTRTVFVGKRYAVKIPRVPTDAGEWRLTHGVIGWIVRGWLGNRSEWRNRRRIDVNRPLLTFGHVAVVFRAADQVGRSPSDYAIPEWYDGDEDKPSSWGRFGDRWLLIDFDTCWSDKPGIVGTIYYWVEARRVRGWLAMDRPDKALGDHVTKPR